jgi:predicted  nucleic acid-binding Zn-ribbon protein
MGIYLTLDIGTTILSIIGTGLFAYVVTKRRDLFPWLPAYFLIMLGQLMAPFSIEKGDAANTVQMIFSLLGIFVIIWVVIREYQKTIIRSNNKNKLKINALLTMAPGAMTTIGISIVMLIFIIITLYLIIKVYLVKRMPIHLFIIITLCLGLFSLIAAVLDSVGVDTTQLSLFLSVIQQSFILSSGFVALIEMRILDSSKKIEKSKNTLEKIINASSETSINVANIATELAASANEVNATSEQVSSTTQTIAHRTQNQAQYLSDINQMANQIKSITKTITNISEQTNLLALNASIEAGRAGEHGLGFAVVATKVQQLAEESKSSVEKTTEIVNTIGSYIKNAASESKGISDAMEEISSAMEEQTASIEEITATTSRLGSLAEDLKETLSRHTNTKSPINLFP